ncbi:MAG: PD40 domain-containing protein [Planctomycetaceae bacterium]|nr:PD40 domain-containing protein [Planctomycetaceae bacterium]
MPVDALSCLQGLEFLESIDMQQGNCSAAHLEHLPQLPALRHIGLYHAVEIDDDAVELLSQHESITVLHLHGARLTNHGLAALTRMRQLVGVWLNDTQVDDSGLPILAELPNLRMLDLSRTKVSADGVRSLHQRLPVCHISSVFDAEELALPEPPSGPELIQNPVLRSLVAASDEWEWTVLQPLGNGINSPGDEGQPCLSADGLTLWWQGTNAADGSWDLYESKRESTAEEFASPMVLPPPINSPEVEVSPSLTVDGRDLFFVSNRRGGRGELDIWSARRNSIDAPFGEPANLGLTINTSAMELSPCISGDGLLLLYSRQGIARRMRTDLYEARRNSRDEPFGRGVPLGRLVNSNGSESVSWLSSDGLTLVVRSDRDTGNGQDRLYLTTRASRDVPFHPPLPLIAPINAGDWTGGFTTSADFSTVVIASRRPGGVGGRDLWITRRVRKSE